MDRLDILIQMYAIFSDNSAVFKFQKVQITNSKIRWKYLLEFKTAKGYLGYLFLNEYRSEPGNYVCVSDFKKQRDYGKQQIRMTLLQTRVIVGEEETIIFQNSHYARMSIT